MIRIHVPLEAREILEQRYTCFLPACEEILETISRTIRTNATENDLSVTLRHRVKSFKSWYVKALKGAAGPVDEVVITDVLGLRIICPFLEEVELISDMLRGIFKVEEYERKGADYPVQHFGYESVHFLIRVPQEALPGKPLPDSFTAAPVCEVQVRTILQDAWAEVEHELVYKSDFTPLDEPLKRKLAALNANLTLSDIMFQEIRDYQKNLHSALKQRRRDFYAHLRREEPARAAARKTLAADYHDSYRETVDSLLLKGLLAHNDGRYDEAVTIYTEILERAIREDIRSIILTHRGMARFSGGMHALARQDFDSALELDPDYSKARYYRAVHARIEGRFAEAFDDLSICLLNDPYNPEYLTARAETHASAGNHEEAREDCRVVLRIEPDFTPALRLQEKL